MAPMGYSDIPDRPIISSEGERAPHKPQGLGRALMGGSAPEWAGAVSQSSACAWGAVASSFAARAACLEPALCEGQLSVKASSLRRPALCEGQLSAKASYLRRRVSCCKMRSEEHTPELQPLRHLVCRHRPQ